MMTDRPIAFLSYARRDDELADGKISEFRCRLRDAYEIVTGDELEIFQDRDDISWGQNWQKTLDLALAGATFLLPILSPLFFVSPHCRDELRKFLEIEAASQRDDLILPVYWIQYRGLEQPTPIVDDDVAELVSELRKRQYKDWRQLRYRDFADPLVRETLEDLAREIEHAFHRPPPAAQAVPGVTGPPPIRAGGDAARKPLEIFRDIDEPWCPAMVVLPTGSFLMGSPNGVGDADERPQHYVDIPHRLAVGRSPVTFAECDRFGAATRARAPKDQGWRRERRPVIDVSWQDAQAYVAWLSRETGKAYRLLSEAEWEYACRAGETTRYSWGDDITPEKANYRASKHGKTTPVGSYPANPWALYDMHGNVWEWVEDHWHDSYEGAPDDGSAWTSGDSDARVLRGGSWNYDPEDLRSAVRDWSAPGLRFYNIGFRVARTLTS